MKEAFDPWTQVQTRHGLAADEVISALQKEIRRGHTENAVLLAYEMATTSPELEQYLWYRLLVISVEDIGFGEPQAPILIETLHRICQTFGHRGGENLLLAVHAVRYLCGCAKDRSSDEMVNWVIHEVEQNGRRPQIPDYALDMHTRRGRAMGRGRRHFWEIGAQIAPELEGRDTHYRDLILRIVQDDTEN